MHMSKGTSAWDQLSTDSAQLLLCDLQPQIVARSKTIEADALGKSAEVLLEVARLFSLPTTLSVVPEGDKAPELISELRGSGLAQEKLRASASPFEQAALRQIIAAGAITTSVVSIATKLAPDFKRVFIRGAHRDG
jgi:hypothetical protein